MSKVRSLSSAPVNQGSAEYDKNPKYCKFCNTYLSYDKRINNFCNNSCAASFNNKGIRRHGKTSYCINCNSKLNCGNKYCSTQCQQDFNWEEHKKELLENGFDIRSKTGSNAKRYLIELNKGKCQICQLDNWNNQPMPLVLDHINGKSEDNSLENLRVICNNCDALTDTYKGKNKGNGRAKRRQRYKEGKSY